MTTKSAKGTSAKTGLETKLVRELAKILNDTDLSEIEMEKGDLKVRVARNIGGETVTYAAPAPAAPIAAPAPVAASAAAPTASASPADNPGAIKSPMVGTAYVRPSPDRDAFISVGDSVKEGDTVSVGDTLLTL